MKHKKSNKNNIVCTICHRAFDKSKDKCPSCGRKTTEIVKDLENSRQAHSLLMAEYKKLKENVGRKYRVDGELKEGDGRKYRAGGKACDYCPFCNGTKDWCPWMD